MTFSLARVFRPARVFRLKPTLAAVALALCIASPAGAAGKQIDAAKLFVRLDNYLKLPPAERSHFTMAFYLRVAGAPLAGPLWLIEGDKRTQIPLRADGKVERLPTLAQLGAARVELAIEPDAKLNEVLGLEPVIAPALDLDARELAAAVAQAGPGMKKIAGVLAFTLPKPKAVLFVGAASGEAELADGRRVPLPLVKGAPAYDPAALPNVRRIHLPTVPRKLDID